MTASDPRPVLVLGLGNILCGDDGAGVAAVAAVRRRYAWDPEALQVLDGGTLGLALLGCFTDARHVILVDAVFGEAPPGTLVRLEGPDVCVAARQRLSAHQVGVAELLDGARLLDDAPPVTLIGVVPAALGLRVGRSPEVEASGDALVEAVVEAVRSLGVRLEVREPIGDAPGDERSGGDAHLARVFDLHRAGASR